MNISVIIPTDGTRQCLALVLAALHDDNLQPNDEVVIVDDASTPRVSDDLADVLAHYPSVRVVRHAWQKGPAAARNTGIRAAANDLLVFTDDDTIPSRGFIEGHREAHDRHPELERCVLGRTGMHPDVPATRMTRYVLKTGWRQFGCDRLLANEQDVAASLFDASNLSVKQTFLTQHGLFDEVFPHADCDARELGWRLAKHGMTLTYVPEIATFLHRQVTLADACAVEYAGGRAFYYFALKHPDAAPPPDAAALPAPEARLGSDDLAGRVRAVDGMAGGSEEGLDGAYADVLRTHFISGLARSAEENGGPQRLHWNGNTWEVMRPLKGGALARLQSARASARESAMIVAGLTPEPPVVFIGTGNGAHIDLHLGSIPPASSAYLFEPHDSSFSSSGPPTTRGG